MQLISRSTIFASLTVAALAGVTAAPALAQNYPTKEVTILAGSAPGGAIDTFSRLVGKYMEQAWGKPVIVVNRAGAGGAVAAAQAKSAAPDGYTLVTSNGGTWTNAWQQMEKPTYGVDDFTYINTFAGGGCAWVTKADSPYKTLKDLIAAAKSGKAISFGAFSNENKIYVDYVGKKEGVQFKSITMKSVPEVLQAVLGGHVDFGFSGGTHTQYVRKGQMRVLAATDAKRVPDSPDVPTLREMGYGVTNCSFFMIAGPKGMPKDVTNKIADAVAKAMQTDEMKKYLASRETEALVMGHELLTKTINEDARAYASAMRALN